MDIYPGRPPLKAMLAGDPAARRRLADKVRPLLPDEYQYPRPTMVAPPGPVDELVRLTTEAGAWLTTEDGHPLVMELAA